MYVSGVGVVAPSLQPAAHQASCVARARAPGVAARVLRARPRAGLRRPPPERDREG